MERTELKFIELYIRITHNGNTIPFEDSMYPVLLNIRGYDNYIKNWENFIVKQRSLHSNDFDEWLNELKSPEDVIRVDEVMARALPSKVIEISWGNEVDFALDVKRIFEHFFQEAKKLCKPVSPNSEITAYYSIDSTGYTFSIYSYHPSDMAAYRNVINKVILKDLTKELNVAVNRFNKAQGKGDKTDNLLIKEAFVSNSASVKKDESISRGHMVSDDTVFEISIYLDDHMVHKEGKGNYVSEEEIIDFFSVLPEEYVAVGPDA